MGKLLVHIYTGSKFDFRTSYELKSCERFQSLSSPAGIIQSYFKLTAIDGFILKLSITLILKSLYSIFTT